MRSSEIARLSGASARMLRHYHRLGILPEPERTPGGYRDYTTADLVRVMRIRMLVEAGARLRDVPELLSEQGGAADLAPLLQELDTRIEALQMRRARLAALAGVVAAGAEIGALTPMIDTALEKCRAAAGSDPLVLEVLAREQEALELLALTHGIPSAFEEAYRLIATDESARARYLDLVERMARLRGHDPADCAQAITRLADDIQHDVALRSLLVPAYADGSGEHDPGAEDGEPAGETDPLLEQLVPDRAQRAVIEQLVAATVHARVDRKELPR